MSKRKPNNPQARRQRSYRAILQRHPASIVNMDRPGQQVEHQVLFDLRTGRRVREGKVLVDAACDIPHRWTIYFGAFCRDMQGKQYIKAEEVAVSGMYKAASLGPVIADRYERLVDSCNPKHRIGSGWIATPADVSLTEEQAARIFDAAGAWLPEYPA